VNVNDLPLERGSASDTASICLTRVLSEIVLEFRRKAIARGNTIELAITQEDEGIFRLAKASS
jgi:hypothetical protein